MQLSDISFHETRDINPNFRGIAKFSREQNTHDATGPDNGPATVLKNCPSALTCYLSFIVLSKSMSERSLTQGWVTAHVASVYNTGTNRPISLTFIVRKPLEHILCSNITRHLEKHDFIMNHQHGFRSGAPCATLLLEFHHASVITVELGRAGAMSIVFSLNSKRLP